MTHLFFLPDDQTFILLDSPLPADQLAESINAGQWTPPPAIAAALEAGWSLKAVCFGKLVIAILIEPPGQPLSQAGQPARSGLGDLSARQNQILKYLIEGLTTHQIAVLTGLHPRTVQYHISFIKNYFQAGTRAESIGRAVGSGQFREISAGLAKYLKRKRKSKLDLD